MQPSTIKIFLVDGSPQGLRTVEISNWTGKAIACPRSQLKDLLSRDEAKNPGVYVLSGVDAETGDAVIYVGEAEDISKRLRSHRERDFWNKSIVFVSKDENLTKAHIKFLEGHLIERAQKVANAKLINAQIGGSHLPESDSAQVIVFLDKVYQLLPILAIDAFNLTDAVSITEESVYYCKIKDLMARGRRTANGFEVLQGSEAVMTHRASAKKWTKTVRENLIDAGILEDKNDRYVFTKDFEFGSPSTAGATVRGGSTNGLKAWKTEGGKTVKEVEQNL